MSQANTNIANTANPDTESCCHGFEAKILNSPAVAQLLVNILLSSHDLVDLHPGIAGVLIPSLEIKLESTPNICDKAGISYLRTYTKDVEGNPIYGHGEVLAKGTNVTHD
eukprot:3685672-Ditylum_brightwellii.AAC.1